MLWGFFPQVWRFCDPARAVVFVVLILLPAGEGQFKCSTRSGPVSVNDLSPSLCMVAWPPCQRGQDCQCCGDHRPEVGQSGRWLKLWPMTATDPKRKLPTVKSQRSTPKVAGAALLHRGVPVLTGTAPKGTASSTSLLGTSPSISDFEKDAAKQEVKGSQQIFVIRLGLACARWQIVCRTASQCLSVSYDDLCLAAPEIQRSRPRGKILVPQLMTLAYWFNHNRLLKSIGYIPPAEAEASYYRQFAEQGLHDSLA